MAHAFDLRVLCTRLVLFTLCTILVLTAFPWSVDAQIFVYPRRPTQSNVRYFDFDWLHIDIHVGEDADTDEAGKISPGSALETLARSFPSASTGDELANHWHHLGPGFGAKNDHFMSAPTTFGASSAQVDSPDRDDDIFPDPLGDPMPQTPTDEPDEETNRLDFEATDLGDRSGGVRLYFYEREREVAERAAAFIDESYRYLVEEFRYVPTETLPYVLYNSYQEFLQTNIFPVQEGVLGVTGRRDLKLVLPYFGDHRLFQHISTHEMVHQFTIQKARDVVREAGVSGDPLDRMPLWYIEGMAEYYALRGLDPETEMLTRDLLLNPDPQRGYVMLDFFEDRPFSSLWTYKVGQARVAFLEEVYGEGTIQDIMEQSYRLVGRRDSGSSPITFRALLVDITGDDGRRISARFERWIKQRSYSHFLDSAQDSPDVVFLNDTRGIMQTMTTSPDGYLMIYRSIQPETGRVRLYITDTRDERRHRRMAIDGTPGVESLHPVGPRNFDLTQDQAVFFARSEGRDVLYLKELRHRAERDDEGNWDVRLRLGSRTSYDLAKHGILAAESPAFSPDGQRVAFIGLDENGQKDVYLFEALEDGDFIVSQLTDDVYAERGLTWGEEGLVFASDATGHGRYNLFRINLRGTGEPERLTFEARDHFEPHIVPDGRLFFSAFDNSRSNLYQWTDQGLIRRTDIVTGFFGLASGPGNSVWTTFHHRGQRRPVRLAEKRLLEVETEPEAEDLRDPQQFPTRSLEDAEPYRATQIRNWQLSNAFGVLGASSAGIFGQLSVITNDRLRNHAIFLNLLAFGDLNNTIADLLYLNQERRLIWGAGLFQDVRYRIDRTIETEGDLFSGERFYGGRGTLRYPLNRFFFVQGGLAVGGVSFFLPEPLSFIDDESEARWRATESRWEEVFDRPRFQTSPNVSVGYNSIRYHPGTGPLSGSSILVDNTLDVQPFDGEVHGALRLDAERYFPIYDRINFSLRGGIGTTYGGELRRQFFLSSHDTLRGVEFGRQGQDFLLGDVFLFSKAELRFPLNFILRVPLIDIEGVVGADFGGAGNDVLDVWRWRAFSPVAGLNFGLGPLVFRLHFARPIDIGAPRLPNNGDWITNFSLGWRYW